MGQTYSKPLTRAQKEALELRKQLQEKKKSESTKSKSKVK